MRLLSYMTPGFPESLFESIGRAVGATVEYETKSSGPEPGENPFLGDGVELGWICSTSFVDSALTGDDPSIQLVGVAWVPDDSDANGRPVYFADIVTRADSPIQSFADLEGHTMACNDPVSLSGHYALKFELDDRGLPDGFVDLRFTGGHQASLTAVAKGEVDVALVDSVVRTARARVDPAVAKLRVLGRLGPWPTQPLVAAVSLTQDEVAAVRRRLLDAVENDALRAELRSSALSHLVEVTPDHYNRVRDAMNRLAD